MSAVTDIHWNQLKLSIPASWETIVKSPLHLIFEHDLSPYLEIRWQKQGKRVSRRHTKAIVKQFDQPPSPANVPQDFPGVTNHLKKKFDVIVLNNTNQHGVPSLLLVCRECGTTILIGMHRKSLDWHARKSSVLESLQCNHESRETEYWQIQDFFFTVPSGFELDSCAFQFGISDLLFKHKHADMRICRLAPASEHLKRNDFRNLFASFCSAPLESMRVVDTRTLRYHTTPTGIARFWQRMRRKRPFRQASFNHFPDSDRILGYMIAGNHPAAAGREAQLENGYGIIQETTEETVADP